MEKYFAASNSAKGFCSYYDECFSGSDKLYIIKGGPGTGKSGFMRRCAVYAERKGYSVEYFYCSSDPDSLDGIIVHKGKKDIAVLDGTAPHTYDLVYPGVRDNIINLGDAWDEEALEGSREKIVSLSKEKSDEYNRAYDALGSCGNLSAVIDSYAKKFIKLDKLNLAAQKLVEKLEVSGSGRTDIRLIDSVSMRGRVRFRTFEEKADVCVVIGDTYSAGHIMLESIKDQLDFAGCDYYISFDPITPKKINGIFERGKKIAFVLADARVDLSEDEKKINYINMKRFIGKTAAELKGELKYTFALYKSCRELALKHLEKASRCHFALEEIYKAAMNFEIVDQKIFRFCEEHL